jgi:hypothetical protein
MSARWVASGTLSWKVTMYETGAPVAVGVVVVVAVEVVPYCESTGVVSVVEAVLVEDASVVSVVGADVVSVAAVVSVPVTVSITWPNAPEARSPSTNSNVIPNANFTFRCRNVRRTL